MSHMFLLCTKNCLLLVIYVPKKVFYERKKKRVRKTDVAFVSDN